MKTTECLFCNVDFACYKDYYPVGDNRGDCDCDCHHNKVSCSVCGKERRGFYGEPKTSRECSWECFNKANE